VSHFGYDSAVRCPFFLGLPEDRPMRPRWLVIGTVVLGVIVASALFVAHWLHSPVAGSAEVEKETNLLRQQSGQVTDSRGPVAGARVRVKGRRESVQSDDAGRFRLDFAGKTGRLTAWKDGFLIAGLDADTSLLEFRLQPLPVEDCPRYSWVDPAPDPANAQACANCHQAMYDEWAASAHSCSATGKHFRNLYNGTDWNGEEGAGWSLLAEHPLGSGVCASCHAPALDLESPALFDLTKIGGVAAKGVHCDYCHKVRGLGEGTIGLTHGRFNLELLRPAQGQLFFGPLDDVDRGEDAYLPFYQKSEYCASCHEGIVFGVHVYSTYSEWRESPAGREGKQCQACHMKPTGKMTNVAPGKGGIERDPKTLANHRFFDGSQEEMLKECVRLALRTDRGTDSVKVSVEIGVENVGHRVPTGFIDRHLILEVEAFDPSGSELGAASGSKLPSAAGKPWAGRSGKLYAKLVADENGNAPLPFWQAEVDPIDTRLTPGHLDRSEYQFPTEVRRVRARVVYRRFWREVAEVKKWPDEDFLVTEREVQP
jgi:hypothetical protein